MAALEAQLAQTQSELADSQRTAAARLEELRSRVGANTAQQSEMLRTAQKICQEAEERADAAAKCAATATICVHDIGFACDFCALAELAGIAACVSCYLGYVQLLQHELMYAWVLYAHPSLLCTQSTWTSPRHAAIAPVRCNM